MLEDGLEYPFRGEWIGRTLIGGTLTFFSFLILPIIIVNGYLVEVLRDTVHDTDTPPSFSEKGWETLTVKGIVAFLIMLAYSIVPMILYFIAATAFAIGGDLGNALAGIGVVSLLIFIPFMLLIYYIIPAALTNYAVEDDINAAFDFDTIKPVIFSSEYFIAVLLPIVIAFILWVATIILAITIIGLVFVPFIQFYGQVAVYRMFGQAYKSAAP